MVSSVRTSLSSVGVGAPQGQLRGPHPQIRTQQTHCQGNCHHSALHPSWLCDSRPVSQQGQNTFAVFHSLSQGHWVQTRWQCLLSSNPLRKGLLADKCLYFLQDTICFQNQTSVCCSTSRFSGVSGSGGCLKPWLSEERAQWVSKESGLNFPI